MNTKELAKELVMRAKSEDDITLTEMDAVTIIDILGNLITTNVHAMGNEVSIAGFGVFKRKDSPPRTARNPRSGEPVEVPAKMKLTFTPVTKFRK